MSKLCEGFPKTTTQEVLQWANLGVGVLYSSTSILTCIWLYRKPGAFKTVPWFVTLQMAALIIMVPFSLAFITLNQKDFNIANVETQPTLVENAMATMEDFLLISHEWIYTDQFLKTVLWLDLTKLPAPGQSEEDFYKERKQSINKITGILSAIYYSMVTAWTIMCIIIDNFAFRMS